MPNRSQLKAIFNAINTQGSHAKRTTLKRSDIPSRTFTYGRLFRLTEDTEETGSAGTVSMAQSRSKGNPKQPAEASPSASIILVSPSNKVLLLHRVKTSSAFPSAHVFPGGNISKNDGFIPLGGKERHMDNLAYRTGAIREMFEESGILLARRDNSTRSLLEVSATERVRGRRAIHSGKVRFLQWLKHQSTEAVLDTDSLVPFTHWITPPNIPKRYTTQMYVYFVPLREEGNPSIHPTSDDVEVTAAEFLPAKEWVERSRQGDIILFPPQYLLLSLVSQHLDLDKAGEIPSYQEVIARREKLREFILNDSSPPWKEKFISPIPLDVKRSDGRTVLGLDRPGLELKESGLRGESDRVVFVSFRKEGPRKVEVGWRQDVLAEEEKRRQGGKKDKEAKL